MRHLAVVIGLAVALSVGGAIAIQSDDGAATKDGPRDAGPPAEPASIAEGPSADAEAGTDIVVYGDALPSSTGWFLVPIEADEATSVHVELRPHLDNRDDQPKIAAPIVLQHDQAHTFLLAAGQDKDNSMRIGGEEVDCCTARFGGERGRAELGGWFGTSPEVPLYLGLVASGWSEGDNITIRAHSPRADVRTGTTLTGTDVEAVNLFDRAREDPHLRVRGENRMGSHEDLDLAWTAQDNGFVNVAWDLHEAQADIEVTLPNGTAVDNRPNTDTSGWVSATGGPGDVRLSFANASRERPHDGEAYALFADIDAPHRTLQSWQQ